MTSALLSFKLKQREYAAMFLKTYKTQNVQQLRDLVRILKNNTASMCQDTKTLAKGC